VGEATRERILDARDSAALDRWLGRAVTATSLDEILAKDTSDA
jgi:hypothetical protein